MNVATRLYHKANKSKNKIYRFFVRQFLSLFFNCDVPFNKNIASTVGFHHNMRGMVISLACSIGENCEIYHHVTIGAGPGGYPKIGNNVLIYTGAVIVGGITVGDGAIITANSCVYHDVPANYVMQGNPAQVRRIRSNLANKKTAGSSNRRFFSSVTTDAPFSETRLRIFIPGLVLILDGFSSEFINSLWKTMLITFPQAVFLIFSSAYRILWTSSTLSTKSCVHTVFFFKKNRFSSIFHIAVVQKSFLSV